MPIYITQGRYTRDAVKGMIVKPEDRADAVGRAIAKAGGGGVTDLRTTVAMTSMEAKGAFAAAGDLAPGFKSAGGT